MHHMGSDLVQVGLPSLGGHDSLPKGGCPSPGDALSGRGGLVNHTWRHHAEPPGQPVQDPWQKDSLHRLLHR